ncbi:ABC transporter ATP-binding protein [Herbaspirillum sp. LeCh32-8]|uniref:ABC transporter ATP-binding protein n=1 Tax=Herbaspirillum sp. LeCh32-8 TaxID=2821356 RepID=UPI001AEB0BD2|nr:ABC transporter ATP-binding protein [Herbaspirillum sp. LeCh32-8]MBP0597530.1 ABC transporter ATP-binding protein [Herbaspirillum sp. LeCh32-8]
MSAIDIRGVARRFGALQALDGVDLSIAQGEFFSLLGPSGCGKTTLLNIIAGFLEPSAGSVAIGGRDITRLAPHQRDIGMVFQNYALFPHLNVFDNVAYGLRVRKFKGDAVRERVAEMLALVRLSELAERMPHQLSGGQQQRVAIARALAIRPQVLLLDEPLSNLDAKLRKDMQAELRRLQRDVGITTVMVTHDQEEALGLSDRIGILGGGHLQQVGTPLALYRQPANRFVGEFVGQANLIAVQSEGGGYFNALSHAAADGVPLRLLADQAGAGGVLFLLRPERIRLAEIDGAPAAPNAVDGTVREASYAGAELHLTVALAGAGELQVAAPESLFGQVPPPGVGVRLSWEPHDLVALPDADAAGARTVPGRTA